MTTELDDFEQRWAEFADLEHLVNHWWWRPGWKPGRSFYTWHLTFDHPGAAPLHELVARLQHDLADVDGLDLIPQQWLHLTMQGLGFTDEVSDQDVADIVDAARDRLAFVPGFDLVLGPVEGDDEATGLLVRPRAAITWVRDLVRTAISTVWDEVPEGTEFRPHVSIAYSSADVPTGPLRQRLAALRGLESVTVPVRGVQLIRLNRDEQMYTWDVVAEVALGPAGDDRDA